MTTRSAATCASTSSASRAGRASSAPTRIVGGRSCHPRPAMGPSGPPPPPPPPPPRAAPVAPHWRRAPPPRSAAPPRRHARRRLGGRHRGRGGRRLWRATASGLSSKTMLAFLTRHASERDHCNLFSLVYSPNLLLARHTTGPIAPEPDTRMDEMCKRFLPSSESYVRLFLSLPVSWFRLSHFRKLSDTVGFSAR